MIRIKLVSLALGDPTLHDGRWLRQYDADGESGRGSITTTDDPERAMTFDGLKSALELLRRQTTLHPLRDDGRPNRPLTAYTVEMVSDHE